MMMNNADQVLGMYYVRTLRKLTDNANIFVMLIK